jgi:hypothetical protein
MPAAGGSAMLDAAEADGVKQDEQWDPMRKIAELLVKAAENR